MWEKRILTEVSWASVEVGGREPIPLPPFEFRAGTPAPRLETNRYRTEIAKVSGALASPTVRRDQGTNLPLQAVGTLSKFSS